MRRSPPRIARLESTSRGVASGERQWLLGGYWAKFKKVVVKSADLVRHGVESREHEMELNRIHLLAGLNVGCLREQQGAAICFALRNLVHELADLRNPGEQRANVAFGLSLDGVVKEDLANLLPEPGGVRTLAQSVLAKPCTAIQFEPNNRVRYTPRGRIRIPDRAKDLPRRVLQPAPTAGATTHPAVGGSRS
jgi:hypothetical protein